MYLINIHVLLFHAVKKLFPYPKRLWRYRLLKLACARPCHPKGWILAIFRQVGYKSKISPAHRKIGKRWEIRTQIDFQASMAEFYATLAREKSIIGTIFFIFKEKWTISIMYLINIHVLLFHAVQKLFPYPKRLWRYRLLKLACARPCHPKGWILIIFSQVGHKSKISPAHRKIGKRWEIRTQIDFQASMAEFYATLAREKSIIGTIFFIFKSELYY